MHRQIDSKAITEVVGIVLVMAIITSGVTFVMVWGQDYMDYQKRNVQIESASNQFIFLNKAIVSSLFQGEGASTKANIVVDSGYINLQSKGGTRFVFYYPIYSGFNITISGFNITDPTYNPYKFSLKMIPSYKNSTLYGDGHILYPINASVSLNFSLYNAQNGSLIENASQIPVIWYWNHSELLPNPPNLIFEPTFTEKLQGAKRIDIIRNWSDAGRYSELLICRIWIFDQSVIKYESPGYGYNLIIEGGGTIIGKPQYSQLDVEPLFIAENRSLGPRARNWVYKAVIIGMQAQGNSVFGSQKATYEFTAKVDKMNVDNHNVIKIGYNPKEQLSGSENFGIWGGYAFYPVSGWKFMHIQIFGTHSSLWINYLKENFNLANSPGKQDTYNMLYEKKFSLLYSACSIDVKVVG